MSVDSAPIPNTLSQIQRNSAHSDLQPIAADYYNITNANGSPVAGLLVLMDRRQRPVRAELHLHDGTAGSLQELAQRQAHLLISNRYSGRGTLPLNILRTRLEQEPIGVPLAAVPPPPKVPVWLKPAALGLLAVIFVVAIGWFLNDLLTPDTPVADVPSAPVLATQTTLTAVVEDAAETNPVTAANGPGDGIRIFQQNGLAASRNALPLDIGQRVRIRAGYQVALRTEAGATAGSVLGAMEGGDEATIVNGPIWLEGTSDTIVWWYIQLDDGTRAWVAANTSELTLLEPVP